MGASVIAHGNSAPVLEPTKHDFNFVPLLIEVFIIKNRLFSVLFGGNARRDASVEQSLTKPVCIIATISQQFLGFR